MRAAESRWVIPKQAALGLYDVALQRGERRWSSGSLRVEAFRVPLVDARLSVPAGVLVAPREIALQAQLNALSGGPMAAAPLQLSALLRPATPAFAGYEDFSFAPAAPIGATDEEDAGDGSRLVADKLAATTDPQGAAAVVVPGLPALTGPSDLLAELSFTDPNGEVQTVAQRLRLWPSSRGGRPARAATGRRHAARRVSSPWCWTPAAGRCRAARSKWRAGCSRR